MIQTIIAPSIHRAKQIERQSGNPLARSLTLENFIQSYYERYGKQRLISTEEVQGIMAHLFASMERSHFDYVSIDSEAMEQIASFLIETKRNDVTIEAFGFVSQKAYELQSLLEHYNQLLQTYNLCDRADRDVFVLESICTDSTTLSVFGEIIVDVFEQRGIHFETSKTELKIIETLRQTSRPMSSHALSENSPNFYEPMPAPFGIMDEVATALKIARKLLDSGVDSDEILIVTTSIDEYAPIFESLLDSYGLQGYTSIGTRLVQLLPLLKNNDTIEQSELLIQAKNRQLQLKIQIDATTKRLTPLGIQYDSTKAYEKALSQTRIKSRTKTGLLLTEPNQLLSLDRIGHLIFMGTDMGHFPPQTKEGFLATAAQSASLLHTNSFYASSFNHYEQMKAVTENLYIVTATYKSKTKLARSHIITETCLPYDVSGLLADFELPRHGMRSDDSGIDGYLGAIAMEQSPYDGYDAGSYEVQTLSASQLGMYAMCPRRYFFDRVLKIKAPNKPEEGLEASDKGTIMHRCFELFATDAKNGKIHIGGELDQSLKDHMNSVAKIAYDEFMAEVLAEKGTVENINHRLYFQELTRGLEEGSEASGVLINFLKTIISTHTSIGNFKNSEFEKEFRLDHDFNPVDDTKTYFIKGFIDRFDTLGDEIRIVDYKSKKVSSKIDKTKLAQMQELKDMQLGLYILYARRIHGDTKIESYLQSFKTDYIHAEFAKAATYAVGKEGEYLHYDEAFEQSLIQRIMAIKASMADGDFHYDDSDEKQCEYCDFSMMCRPINSNKTAIGGKIHE